MGIGWAREALSLNPQVPTPPPLVLLMKTCTAAKGEKLSPHPRLDLKGHLKPIPKLKLIPGITTLITMDTHIDIIMGIMATLTTDTTCMANKFENSFSLTHTRIKLENHGNLTLAMIMDKKDKTARAPQQIQNCIHTIELINR